jgi:glycosyltransferase involved in cell wall biosynthesis
MNHTRPRVSIGMPVYNGDRFLAEALDAILAQTYADFELIITDNASSDRTQEICQAYAAEDPRIKYYRNERNLGCHRNYNCVFQLASGEYFRWATHDDLCAPQSLEKCVEVLDRNPDVVLCYTKTKLIDEQGAVLEQNYDENPLLTHSPQPYIRFRNLIIDSFSRPYRGQQLFGVMRVNAAVTTPLLGDYSGADKVFIARMSLLGKFHEVPDYLFFNREHSQRSSSKEMNSPYLRMKWFNPDAKAGKPVFPRWSVFLGYLNAIKEVPLSLSERTRCYLQIGAWLLRNKNWDQLAKELLKAAVWPIYFSMHRRMLLQKHQPKITSSSP